MCGRYTLQAAQELLAEQFQFEKFQESRPRYNIAPLQLVPCVRWCCGSKKQEGAMLRWGLIPYWAKNDAIGIKLFNARSETVSKKPSFQKPLQERRCLVLADGFYEWQIERQSKQPYYIRLKNRRPFAFAGLWDCWIGTDGKMIESCVLLTTKPNGLIAPIHNRMPVILNPLIYQMWLDPNFQDVSCLLQHLEAYPAEEMEMFPVNRTVNNPNFDDQKCLLMAEEFRQ